MDSLYWTSLNPKVKLKQTNKLFWNKYAYKVKLWIPCGNYVSSYLSHRYRDVDAIEYVKRRMRNKTELFYWHSNPLMQKRVEEREQNLAVVKANPTVLEVLKKSKLETDIQFRVEEPYISLYHTKEEVLKNVINLIPKQSLKEILLEVHGLTDSEHKRKLKPNVILNSRIGYKHKVYVRLTPNIRQHGPRIVQYLKSLGKEHAYYTDAFRLELQHRGHSWHSVTYFYCNDPGVLDFINLICPGACSLDNVYKLVPKKHK